MKTIIYFITKYILGYVLQDAAVVLGIFTFSHQKVQKNVFALILSVLLPCTIIVRLLPISYGIHILVNLAVVLYMTHKLCHFELYNIIKGILLTTLIIIGNELLFLLFIRLILGSMQAQFITQSSYLSSLLYLPFNLISVLIIFICYKQMLKKYDRS